MLSRAPLALAALVPVLLISGCGSSDDTASDRSTDAASGSKSAAAAGATTCQYKKDGSSGGITVTTPPAKPTVSGDVPATIHTSVGDLKLTLNADAAPCTVNSFVSLAMQGFYDNTTCHRLGTVTGFAMLQCGDPLGNGSGGPGYAIPDEYKGDETYPAGTVAMARTSEPNSGGSQFFLVFGDTQLNPEYTVFGTMDEASIKTLEKVAAGGTDNSEAQGVGHPKTEVSFTAVAVE